VNAVLLLPLLAYMSGIAKDRELMGNYAAGRAVVIGLITVCILALGVLSLPR
jgi:hypothetical protein